MSPKETVRAAVELLGGPAAVGEQFEITSQAVSRWMANRIPAEHCPTLERLTGGKYRCEQMRPDVEWSVLRGTSPISSSTGASTP